MIIWIRKDVIQMGVWFVTRL